MIEVKNLGTSLNRLQTTLIPLEPGIKGLRADLRKMGIVIYLEDPESLVRAARHLKTVDQTLSNIPIDWHKSESVSRNEHGRSQVTAGEVRRY